jgi:hypothetical protein
MCSKGELSVAKLLVYLFNEHRTWPMANVAVQVLRTRKVTEAVGISVAYYDSKSSVLCAWSDSSSFHSDRVSSSLSATIMAPQLDAAKHLLMTWPKPQNTVISSKLNQNTY